MVVYLDGIIGLNFLVDLLLLLGVDRLSGYPLRVGRAAAGAAVGGGYAGMCLVPGFRFLGSVIWRITSLGVMSMAAFGLDRSALRRGLLFVILSMALGGLAMSFQAGKFSGLMGCCLILMLLCFFGFGTYAGGRRLLNVVIDHRGNHVSLLALRDTGNTLADPVTGEGILVVSRTIGSQLLGIGPEWFSDPVGAMQAYPGLGLRLIPYHAVGGRGFLLGVRCDNVRIGNQAAGRMVAFSPEEFASNGYQGLTGGQYG